MRVTILALGSRGDVQPLVALGMGLRDAGHRVRLATFENFRPLVTGHGLDLCPIRGDARQLLQGRPGLSLADSGHNVIRNHMAIMRSFGALGERYAQDLSDPTLWETDAIINQLPGALFGIDAAEKLGVPHFSAAVMPLTRTTEFPLLFFPRVLSALPGYNLASYLLAEQLVWHPFRRLINRWRKRVFDMPEAPFWGHFDRMTVRRLPILNGYSPHVVPRPRDWGSHVHVTGYWFLDDYGWQPPADLLEFVSADPAPVFIGFGSMPVRDPARLTALVLEALRECGLRAVLSAGWAGIGEGSLPAEVIKIDFAPYSWLFPRMAAVVHHGGSGTTAEGLRAGVPSVLVPFVMDQFYWGNRIAALGVGPQSIPFKKLSVERLAAAISAASGDPEIRRKAASLGQQVRDEAGVANAVQAFHHHLDRV